MRSSNFFLWSENESQSRPLDLWGSDCFLFDLLAHSSKAVCSSDFFLGIAGTGNDEAGWFPKPDIKVIKATWIQSFRRRLCVSWCSLHTRLMDRRWYSANIQCHADVCVGRGSIVVRQYCVYKQSSLRPDVQQSIAQQIREVAALHVVTFVDMY